MVVKTTEQTRNVTLTIGNAAQVEVCPSREGSQVLILERTISNNSTGGQIISLAYNAEAVAGQGIVLQPAACRVEAYDGHYRPTLTNLNAISSAAGGSLSVFERIVGV